MTKDLISLEELYNIVKQRIDNKDPESYSYKIAKKGAEIAGRKVGEEAIEVVMAGLIHEMENSDQNREDLIGEVADLYYHSLILLAQRGISFEEVLEELDKRNNSNRA